MNHLKADCPNTAPNSEGNCPVCAGGIFDKKQYQYRDHSHCWTSVNPPCGLKGKHRCCLCELPPEEDICNNCGARNCFCNEGTPKNEEGWLEGELTKAFWNESGDFPHAYVKAVFKDLLDLQRTQERERMTQEFGDFAHKHYLGCYADELGKWHYSYDTEAVYLFANYLATNANVDSKPKLTDKERSSTEENLRTQYREAVELYFYELQMRIPLPSPVTMQNELVEIIDKVWETQH